MINPANPTNPAKLAKSMRKPLILCVVAACALCFLFVWTQKDEAEAAETPNCSEQIALARKYAYSAKHLEEGFLARLEEAYKTAWLDLNAADPELAERIADARAVVLRGTRYSVMVNRYGFVVPSGEPNDFLKLFPGWEYPDTDWLADIAAGNVG